MTSSNAKTESAAKQTSSRMPVIFAGHGSPIHALSDNKWTQGFAALASLTPGPTAILAISAHWYVDGTYVMGNPAPTTIHDFSGFPKALFDISYPAKGDVDLAKRIRDLLADRKAELRTDWSLDHGTWGVLRAMFPQADVPVLQLSIDRRLSPGSHLDIGRSLADLRSDGILIFASGNITHNLRDAMGRMRSGSNETPP